METAGLALAYPTRLVWWSHWREASVPQVLGDNRDDLRRRGIDGAATLRRLCEDLRATKPEEEAIRLARRRLQRALTQQIWERSGATSPGASVQCCIMSHL